MTRAGDLFVECCACMHGIPHRWLCLAVVIMQGTLLNIYLHDWMGPLWFCWFAYDTLNVVLFFIAFVLSQRWLEQKRKGVTTARTIGWLVWLILQVGTVSFY